MTDEQPIEVRVDLCELAEARNEFAAWSIVAKKLGDAGVPLRPSFGMRLEPSRGVLLHTTDPATGDHVYKWRPGAQ